MIRKTGINRLVASGIAAVTLLAATACVAHPYAGYYTPVPAYAPYPYAPYPATTFSFGFYDDGYPDYYDHHHHYNWGYWHGDGHRHWGGHWEGREDHRR